MGQEILKGTVAKILITARGDDGARENASSTPVVDFVLVNGVGVATTDFTIAQAQDDTPASVEGVYVISFPTDSYNNGTQISIGFSATIDGVSVKGLKSALITSPDGRIPTIS